MVHTRSGDPYVESTPEKSIPRRCPCGMSIAIFEINYTWWTTSGSIPICWMAWLTSELSVCNVEKWNDTSKFQVPATSLFVNENIKCGYGFSYLDQKEHFGSKLIWIFCTLYFASLQLPLSCPLNRAEQALNDTTFFFHTGAKPHFPLERWTLWLAYMKVMALSKSYVLTCLSLFQDKLKLVTILGAGLLVGTALSVIIPEGIHAMSMAGEGTCN